MILASIFSGRALENMSHFCNFQTSWHFFHNIRGISVGLFFVISLFFYKFLFSPRFVRYFRWSDPWNLLTWKWNATFQMKGNISQFSAENYGSGKKEKVYKKSKNKNTIIMLIRRQETGVTLLFQTMEQIPWWLLWELLKFSVWTQTHATTQIILQK